MGIRRQKIRTFRQKCDEMNEFPSDGGTESYTRIYTQLVKPASYAPDESENVEFYGFKWGNLEHIVAQI